MRHLFNSSKGFSLIEMVVVVALTALIGTALTGMIQYFYRNEEYVLQEGTAVQNARQGLATAVQNLREASYGEDGSYPIAAAATSSVTFFADLNNDGNVEEVTYFLAGNTFYRGVTYASGNPPSYAGQPESTSTIAMYVQNNASTPIFQYYDDTGALLPSPVNVASIALVTTDLQIDVDTKRAPSTYSLIGSAMLRNLEN